MNKKRKAKLQEGAAYIAKGIEILRCVYSEEEDAVSNTPESLQSGSRYEEMEEGLDTLEQCIDDLDCAITLLDDL